MLTWIIVILLILWLLGYFGPNLYSGIPRTGNVLHILLVIVVILIILRVLESDKAVFVEVKRGGRQAASLSERKTKKKLMEENCYEKV